MKLSRESLQRLGSSLVNGSTDENDDIDVKRKIVLLYSLSMIGIINLIALGAVSFYHRNMPLFTYDCCIAIILLVNLIYLRKTNNHTVTSIVGMSFVGTLFYYLFLTGGDRNTGHLWYYTFPLFACFLLGSRKGAMGMLILFIPALLFLIIQPEAPYVTSYSPDFAMRFISSFIVVSAFSYLYERTREKSQRKLIEKNSELNYVITDLQHAEKGLREAGEKLERRVEDRTRELTIANKNLMKEMEERKRAEDDRRRMETQLLQAKKMEAVGTLAGGVAHDLNNILAGVVGYPELLLMKLPDDSPLRKSILTIQKSGEKAAAIVQDLLTLARRGVMVKEVLILNHIVSDYLGSPEFEKLKLHHPNLRIHVTLEENPLPLEGSYVHLSKALMNLVSNAAEAMPEGGDIRISTRRRHIERTITGFEVVRSGNYMVLECSDTGEGIGPENLERIFEPFYTKKVMGRSGTGLGMAVVWGTVKDHSGYIDIKSRVGHGSTFSLYLPVTENEVSKEKSSPGEYKGGGESILIVDDVDEQREVASEMLSSLGYQVDSVPSGEMALEYLKSHDVDLLLLDMIMDPGIDGLETYKKVQEIHPGQKAVIVSGYSETERVRECQSLGAGCYIKKPFVREKIGMAVKRELNKGTFHMNQNLTEEHTTT